MLGQVIHRHWVDRIRELEAEYLGVEGSPTRSDRRISASGGSRAVALGLRTAGSYAAPVARAVMQPGHRPGRAGQPCHPRPGSTIRGRVIWSMKWIGDRSR